MAVASLCIPARVTRRTVEASLADIIRIPAWSLGRHLVGGVGSLRENSTLVPSRPVLRASKQDGDPGSTIRQSSGRTS
jgi:hypothetical protein